MLYIKTKDCTAFRNADDFIPLTDDGLVCWNIDSTITMSMSRIDYSIEYVEADGAELGLIKQLGIKINSFRSVGRWFGDDAKFIVANLVASSGAEYKIWSEAT